MLWTGFSDNFGLHYAGLGSKPSRTGTISHEELALRLPACPVAVSEWVERRSTFVALRAGGGPVRFAVSGRDGWCRCRPMAPGSRCAVPCHQPLGGCTATPADAYSNPSGSRWGPTGPKRPITSTNGTSCGTLRGANGAARPVRVTLRTCRCDQTAAPRVVGMIVQELQRAARWPQSE